MLNAELITLENDYPINKAEIIMWVGERAVKVTDTNSFVLPP